MTPTDATLNQYIHDIQATLATKQATEPSYYSAIEKLVESLGDGVTATALPRHIECGAAETTRLVGCIMAQRKETPDISISEV